MSKKTGKAACLQRESLEKAQLSLAWLLAQKPFIVPIPGTGKVKHLQENIESSKLVLTAEDLRRSPAPSPSSRCMAVG